MGAGGIFGNQPPVVRCIATDIQGLHRLRLLRAAVPDTPKVDQAGTGNHNLHRNPNRMNENEDTIMTLNKRSASSLFMLAAAGSVSVGVGLIVTVTELVAVQPVFGLVAVTV